MKYRENSLYTVIAVEHDTTIAMSKLIGDGQYYLIADIICGSGIREVAYNKLEPF